MAVSQSLTLTQVSQNVAGNSSQIRIVWLSTQTGESYNAYSKTAKYYVSINGGTEVEHSISYTLPKGTTATILDTTLTAQHRADGTCTVAVRTWMDTGISAGVITLNKSLTPSSIPRATTPSVSNNNVSMGSRIRINTPRASSAFTHDLAYSFAGGAYVSIATGVGEYYDWTTPDLSTSIPNNTEGTVTIRCVTKQNGAAIGNAKTVTMTLRVPTSAAYQPTISVTTMIDATEGLAAQFGTFVKGKSTVKVVITAAGAKGSTIKSYRATLDGGVYTTASFTTPVLSQAGELDLLVIATDSRGRTASQVYTLYVQDYQPPTISELEVYRVDAAGAANDDGEHVAVHYGYGVTTPNDRNTARMVIEYKRADANTWTQLLTGSDLVADEVITPASPTFSTDYEYTFRLTVTDWFGASRVLLDTLPSGAVILDFAADGQGFGVGTTSQEHGMQVAWPSKMTGGFTPIPLEYGTDADTLLTPNIYYGKAYSNYANVPDNTRDFTFEVLPAGPDGQLMQRITTCVPLAPVTFTRFYVSGAWQPGYISGFESIWQGATLSSNFALYDSSVGVQYRRSGGVVEIKGVVKPTKTITNADGWVTITTLPEGYRPGGGSEVNCVCQGGGTALWLMRITTGGAVQLARYQQGGSAVDVAAGVRLPFSVTFLADR